MSQPYKPATPKPALVILCLALVANGVYIVWRGLPVMKTGDSQSKI